MSDELDKLRGSLEELVSTLERKTPYSTGSMFFDDAPTTRLRARAATRRDIAGRIRAILDAS